MEQGAAAEAATDGANEAIDGVTNIALVLVADWFLEEKWLKNNDRSTISSQSCEGETYKVKPVKLSRYIVRLST